MKKLFLLASIVLCLAIVESRAVPSQDTYSEINWGGGIVSHSSWHHLPGGFVLQLNWFSRDGFTFWGEGSIRQWNPIINDWDTVGYFRWHGEYPKLSEYNPVIGLPDVEILMDGETITIQISDGEPFSLSIYDITGQLIYHKYSTSGEPIAKQEFISAFNFAVLERDGHVFTQKLLIK